MQVTEHSPSALRNREPIFTVLDTVLQAEDHLLEIGSGTAEHALLVTERRADVYWQPSEHPTMLERLERCIDAATPRDKLLAPIPIDVFERPWKTMQPIDLVYTCNTLHMMPWAGVAAIFAESARLFATAATPKPRLCVYGPMAVDGDHVSAGNRDFDQQLRASNPALGIRDLTALRDLARQSGFVEDAVHEMPANNRFVIWRR